MHDVRLKVAGSLFGGWEQIRISRGIEQVAGSFELSVTERWPGQSTSRPIHLGDACEVLIDGEPVITGYIDDSNPVYDDTNHTLSFSGRDKTADLVDCSADAQDWKDQTLLQVARKMCQPFGITVSAPNGSGQPFTRLKTEEGMTIFEALESGARIRGRLLISDGQGALIITRAGSHRISTRLELGQNIKTGSGQFSHRDRFSQYTVKGQQAGNDFLSGDAAAQVIGTATDKEINRYRPLTIMAEDQVDTASATQRATWDRNVRWGRSKRVTYTVQGWMHAEGLWQPNTIVPVRDHYLGIDKALLITQVNYLLDSNGMTTELTVTPTEAFDLVELPEPETEGGVF